MQQGNWHDRRKRRNEAGMLRWRLEGSQRVVGGIFFGGDHLATWLDHFKGIYEMSN